MEDRLDHIPVRSPHVVEEGLVCLLLLTQATTESGVQLSAGAERKLIVCW